MKASSNPSTKPSEDGMKSKFVRKAPDYVLDQYKGQPPYKKQALSIMPSSPIQSYRSAERFTPLRLTIDEVFNTFKDQPWVRRPKPIQPKSRTRSPSTGRSIKLPNSHSNSVLPFKLSLYCILRINIVSCFTFCIYNHPACAPMMRFPPLGGSYDNAPMMGFPLRGGKLAIFRKWDAPLLVESRLYTLRWDAPSRGSVQRRHQRPSIHRPR